MHLIRALRARLADAGGFSMLVVLAGMTITTALSLAAFAAANGDLHLARNDQDQKRALAAAEAGVNEYLYHLNNDNSYWANCDSVPAPAPVNQYWNGSGAQPTWKWRNLPNSDAKYKIELLPTTGNTKCVLGSYATVIDPSSGQLRIRSVGDSNGVRRGIVATLRRQNFLDYIWFTDEETSDPTQYTIQTRGYATKSPDIVSWASTQCDKHARDGRQYIGTTLQYWQGQYNDPNIGYTTAGPPTTVNGKTKQLTSQISCTGVNFRGGDVLNGPMHTNDEYFSCNGVPIFGRARTSSDGKPRDAIEWSGTNLDPCDSSSNADFGLNVKSPGAPELTAPPSNTALKQVALPGYVFNGQTTLEFSGTQIKVTNAALGWNQKLVDYPSNGVIYVQNNTSGAGCASGYDVLSPYTDSVGCGDAMVKGTYTSSLTIGAEKDVVVMGNVLTGSSGSPLLGLIANNFVRVYHRLATDSQAATCTGSTALTSDYLPSVEIDAAILSLNHVFTVDNYQCGQRLGNLTVLGAIAQHFRGPVGTTSTGGSGSSGTGYTKNYNYDDRLRYRSPPYFIDPVQSAWRVVRAGETRPAR